MIQKTIYTICLYIGIVGFSGLVFSIFSCEPQGDCQDLDGKIVFTNSSGYDIELVVYGFEGGKHSFFAKNTAKIEQLEASFPSLNYIFVSDSVKIIFTSDDSPKMLTFLPLKNGGKESHFNILDSNNYENKIGQQNCTLVYNYTFTVDDYNNAK